MSTFMITFDLGNASENGYEIIYRWAHERGGYRYFRFPSGGWGRLPSTTIVIPLAAATSVAARDEFRSALERAGYKPTHIAVADGIHEIFSDVLSEWQVPDYAKASVPAYV